MHQTLSLARRAVSAALAVLAATVVLATAQADPDMQLVAKETSITAMVGEEDGEGLWVVAPDGTSYSVWTPENVTLEALSAFQRAYKNKEVTLPGDVYRDSFGNLHLFVSALPQ